MDTAQWLQLVGTVVAVAVGYGALRSQVASLKEQVLELRASRDKLGERVGRLETHVAILQSHHQPRRPTSAVGEPEQP